MTIANRAQLEEAQAATVSGIKRIATIKLCADECGAKCCRNPSMRPEVTPDERRRLSLAGEVLGLDVTFKFSHNALVLDPDTGQEVERKVIFKIDYLDDGACPFLDRDTNLCRIHEARPNACANFPTRPLHGCLVYPAEGLGIPNRPENSVERWA